MKLRAVAIGALVALPFVVVVPLIGIQELDCPSVATLKSYKPPEATRVYAADSSLVADLSPYRRVVVELNEVPKTLSQGFVAVEDRRFYQHDGVDIRGVGRAIVRDVASLSLQEGFSTITMQLVRNVYPEELPFGAKIRRKACEVVLARQVEKDLTKSEILKLYVNQIYMGGGLYGVEAAAQAYFGKPVRQVTAPEAALLIGLIKNPEGYNPRKNPMRAIQRRNTVLEVMAREKVISQSDAARAKAQPLKLAPPLEAAGSAPYYVAAVRRELRDRYGKDADVMGLRVYTGLDPELQKAAQDALEKHLRKIESGAYGTYKHPKPDTTGQTQQANAGASPYLQGLVVAIDPYSGAVRALVGGRDFSESQFDRAFQAKRQPGSAFKPFVMAAALNAGLPITTHFATTELAIDQRGAPVWQPADHIADSLQSLSLRDILAKSSNTGTVRVGQWVGVERVAEMARSAGISTNIPAYPSTFLGAAEVVPAELVAAFASFGNGGIRIEPQTITRIEDARGKVLWRAPTRFPRAMDEGVAYLTLSLMEEVVDRGTAGFIRRSGFYLPAAGKTGTTNGAKDNWFIGLTPDLVAGVWVGMDKPTVIQRSASGSTYAVPIWADFMKRAYRNRPAPAPWMPPGNLVAVPIDTVSGYPATSTCPPENLRVEYFLPGHEPQEFCPLHPENPGNAVERLLRGFRSIF